MVRAYVRSPLRRTASSSNSSSITTFVRFMCIVCHMRHRVGPLSSFSHRCRFHPHSPLMTSASPTRLRAIARDAAVVLIVSYLLGYWHEELPRAAALLLAFVALPLLGGALVWRVHGAISQLLTEHRELLRTREQLHELATRDSLTRLLNRGTILERLTQELERARRHAHPIAVILADIDHFKRVNDTYGHQAGDQVLASVSSRSMAAIRPYDLAGRYGGEELIVVLEGVDECGAMQ